MKIFIDSIWFKIYEWKDGRRGAVLLNHFGPYNAPSFQKIVNAILTPSQLKRYVGADQDLVYSISKKRAEVLRSEIEKLK